MDGALAVLTAAGAFEAERKPDPAVFADKTALKSWVSQTRKCCTEGRLAFDERIRAVDSSFSPPSDDTYKELPLARAEVFFGQLDADKDDEAVIQFVHHGEFEGSGYRPELFWVGVFDRTKRGWLSSTNSPAAGTWLRSTGEVRSTTASRGALMKFSPLAVALAHST